MGLGLVTGSEGRRGESDVMCAEEAGRGWEWSVGFRQDTRVTGDLHGQTSGMARRETGQRAKQPA